MSYMDILWGPVNWWYQTEKPLHLQQLDAFRKGTRNFEEDQVNCAMSALVEKVEWDLNILAAADLEYYDTFKYRVTWLSFSTYYFTHQTAKDVLGRICKFILSFPLISGVKTKIEKGVDKDYQQLGYISNYPPVYSEELVSQFYRDLLKVSKNDQRVIKSLIITHDISLNIFIAISENAEGLTSLEATVESKNLDKNPKFLKALSEFPVIKTLKISADLHDFHVKTIVASSPLIEDLDLAGNPKLGRGALLDIAKLTHLVHLKVRCLNPFDKTPLLEGVVFASMLQTFYLGSDYCILTPFTIKDLTHAVPKNLQLLFLDNLKLDPQELSLLSHFSSLQYLSVHNYIMSDGKLIRTIAAALPQLIGLSLKNWWIYKEEIKEIPNFKGLKSIKLGNFQGCEGFRASFDDLKSKNPSITNLQVTLVNNQPIDRFLCFSS